MFNAIRREFVRIAGLRSVRPESLAVGRVSLIGALRVDRACVGFGLVRGSGSVEALVRLVGHLIGYCRPVLAFGCLLGLAVSFGSGSAAAFCLGH